MGRAGIAGERQSREKPQGQTHLTSTGLIEQIHHPQGLMANKQTSGLPGEMPGALQNVSLKLKYEDLGLKLCP